MNRLKMLVMLLVLARAASSQTTIDCSNGFQNSNQSAACYVDLTQYQGQPLNFEIHGNPGAIMSGSSVLLVPPGGNGGHLGATIMYQSPVSVTAFTVNWTFVPDGKNISLAFNNTDNTPGYQLDNFTAGAGCEAGFYQAFNGSPPGPPPNNIFALELDGFSPLVGTSNGYDIPFTYSSAQIYTYNLSPCIPSYNNNGGYPTGTPPDKYSTSPVPLNSPANQPLTTNGHTYSASVGYDGSTVTLNLYDKTAGGSCPGSACYTHTWPNVNIPSAVGKSTAYMGITFGCNSDCVPPLVLSSFTYTQGGTPPSTVKPNPPTNVKVVLQ